MPSNSRALTVILNYDHNKKFALVLPTLDPPKTIILREARNKFRSKGLTLVFLRGGILLEEDTILPAPITKVWVSKGEPYSGPPPENSRSDQPGEVRIIR